MSIPQMPEPQWGTVTRRRKIRQRIRDSLGISRDGAPDVRRVFSAVRQLDELLNLTTSGAYRLAIVRKNGTIIEPRLSHHELPPRQRVS